MLKDPGLQKEHAAMKRAFEKTLPLKERERIRKEKMEAERAKKEEERAMEGEA